jgi:hypothetical protein
MSRIVELGCKCFQTAQFTAAGGRIVVKSSQGKLSQENLRQGKANLAADVAPIFQRLGTTAEIWKQRRFCPLSGRDLGRRSASRVSHLRAYRFAAPPNWLSKSMK